MIITLAYSKMPCPSEEHYSPATPLLPGQDKLAPSGPMSGESWFVVSGGVRLSEVVPGVIPKPRVTSTFRVANLVPKHPDTP